MQRLLRTSIMHRLLLLSLAFTPSVSTAAETDSGGLTGLVKNNLQAVADKSGLRAGEESDFITPLELFGLYFALLTGFAGVLFLVQVIHGGITWMLAGGNEEMVTKARKKITNGAIGAAIMFISYFFAYFVLSQVAGSVGVDFG